MPRMPLAAGDGLAFFELEGAPSLAFFGPPVPAFFAEEPGVVELEEAFAGGLPALAHAGSACTPSPPSFSNTSTTIFPPPSASQDAILEC